MNANDQRPSVAIAHVVLETDCMEETARFMQAVGMRVVFLGPQVSVLELRGGTHLVLIYNDSVTAGTAPFDLLVDDIHATHKRFGSLGFSPSPIESRPAVHHEVFTVREPAGHEITFFSSHASGRPV